MNHIVLIYINNLDHLLIIIKFLNETYKKTV